MLIHKTPLAGAALNEFHEMEGDRGFSARSFRGTEFEKAGREPVVAQGHPVSPHRTRTPREFHCRPKQHTEATR